MTPVQMQDLVSVAAGATTANMIAGKKYEFAPFDCYLDLLETGSATGLYTNLTIGMLAVVDNARVNANNRIPLEPDDLSISDAECGQGQKIQLQVFNSTAGALSYAYRIVLTPFEE